MPLKVIGAGLGRTGTASLKIALERIGLGPCYHMSEVLSNAGHIDLWLDVAAGKPDWDAIFATFQSTVDFPASMYWRELADAYPTAKIVLSVRDAERWFASTHETIFSRRLHDLIDGTKWSAMYHRSVLDRLGVDTNDREATIAAFNAHNEAVKAAFGPERLLVFEAKAGWGPLCEFFGAPVPDDPYPQVNSKAQFEDVFDMISSPMGQRMMDGAGMDGGSAHEELFKG